MLKFNHLTLALALAVAIGHAAAKPPAPPAGAASAASAPRVEQSTAGEVQLVEHGHYVNSSGADVHSPAHTVDGRVPAGASARCGDGSYSFSQHRRGTCSHHGGVASWL